MPKSDHGQTHVVNWVSHGSPLPALPLAMGSSPALKPTGDRNFRSALHTVDVDSTGERFVTAGADKTVRIWSMSALGKDDASSAPPGDDAALAAIHMMHNSVNAARFANTKSVLAVGDCNGTVCTYRLEPGQGAAEFGSGEGPSRENWVRSHQVMPHPSSDVLDLAWTSDDKWLASGGYDSEVVVLDGSNLSIVHRLSCDGPPKGVAWSPEEDGAGPLLAAQVDVLHREGTVQPFVVWDPRRGWAPLQRGTDEILQGTSQNIQFTRISWAPVGLREPLVMFVNSMRDMVVGSERKKEHVASNFKVTDPMHFAMKEIIRGAGGKRAFTGARFNPKVSRDDKGHIRHVWVMLSLQGQVTMWQTPLAGQGTKPLFVSKKKIFRLPDGTAPEKQTPNDAAWSPDGRKMIAVSEAGVLIYADLPEMELLDKADPAVTAAREQFLPGRHKEEDIRGAVPGEGAPIAVPSPFAPPLDTNQPPGPSGSAAAAVAAGGAAAAAAAAAAAGGAAGGGAAAAAAAAAAEGAATDGVRPHSKPTQQQQQQQQQPHVPAAGPDPSFQPRPQQQQKQPQPNARAPHRVALKSIHPKKKAPAAAAPPVSATPQRAPQQAPPQQATPSSVPRGPGLGSRGQGLNWAGTEHSEEDPHQDDAPAPPDAGEGEAAAEVDHEAAHPPHLPLQKEQQGQQGQGQQAKHAVEKRRITAEPIPSADAAGTGPAADAAAAPAPIRSKKRVDPTPVPDTPAPSPAKTPAKRRLEPTPMSAPSASPVATPSKTQAKKRVAPTPMNTPSHASEAMQKSPKKPRRMEPQRIEPQRIEPQPAEPQRIEPRRIEPRRIEPQQQATAGGSGAQRQQQQPKASADKPRRIQPQPVALAPGVAAGPASTAREQQDEDEGVRENGAPDYVPEKSHGNGSSSGKQGAAGVVLTQSTLLAEVEALGGGGAGSGWRTAQQPRQGPLEASWEEEADGAGATPLVSVRLEVSPSGEVRLTAGAEVSWQARVAPGALHACGSSKFCAVAVPGGILHVFRRKDGHRVLPPLRVGPSVLSLSSAGPHQCVVATPGRIFVWDLPLALERFRARLLPDATGASPASAAPPAPLHFSASMPCSKNGRVKHAKLSASGAPVVVMDTGEIYVWHRELETWALVAGDYASAGLEESCYVGVVRPHGVQGPGGSLAALLEESIAVSGLRRAEAPALQAEGEAAAMKASAVCQSVAHLWHNCTAAAMLAVPGDTKEFSEWEGEFDRFVAAHGDGRKGSEAAETRGCIDEQR